MTCKKQISNCQQIIQMRIVVSITDTFIKIAERHAPLKKRFVRGNQAPFMNKKLRQAIYT